jgi:hypothetical protein
MSAQKKRDAFAVVHEPLPPCGGCDNCPDSEEGKLYILIGEKYLCRKCFRQSYGRTWPRPQRAKLTPASTTRHRRA